MVVLCYFTSSFITDLSKTARFINHDYLVYIIQITKQIFKSHDVASTITTQDKIITIFDFKTITKHYGNTQSILEGIRYAHIYRKLGGFDIFTYVQNI